jgi:biopolymer transport protein TolR
MRRDLSPIADINVTNLVDVALTLLIIFMIAAPMMRAGMDVSLPKTSAARPQPSEGITVTLTSENTIYVGEQAVPLAHFKDRLRRALGERAGAPVFLRADKKVPYGLVVEVVGTIREAGVSELGLVAEPPLKRR